MRSPDEQHDTDWGGFDRLFTVPPSQAVETQRTVALLTNATIALQDELQHQHIELVRTMISSSRDVFEQSRDDQTRTVEVGATAEPAPRAPPKPTTMPDGDRQLPRQSTVKL